MSFKYPVVSIEIKHSNINSIGSALISTKLHIKSGFCTEMQVYNAQTWMLKSPQFCPPNYSVGRD